jgi:hypothetical protein
MTAAWKTCLGKTQANKRPARNPRKLRVRMIWKKRRPWVWRPIEKSQGLQPCIRKSIVKGHQWKLSEHWRTDLVTSNWPWDAGNH